MKITFITSNLNKVKEFQAILGDSAEVDHIKLEYDEIQSEDILKITEDAAKRVCEQLKKPVVVEDSGIFIHALNGFPGTLTKFAYKTLGLQGLITLLDGKENRKAEYRSAVGYCEPNKEPVSFLGTETGTIAHEIKGDHGFGHDPIFIPEGQSKTYGEMENAETIKKFRKAAVIKLREYLQKGG